MVSSLALVWVWDVPQPIGGSWSVGVFLIAGCSPTPRAKQKETKTLGEKETQPKNAQPPTTDRSGNIPHPN